MIKCFLVRIHPPVSTIDIKEGIGTKAVCVCVCVKQELKKKEALNFKENLEGDMGMFGVRKVKGKMM